VGVVRGTDGHVYVTEWFAKTATAVVEPAPAPEPVVVAPVVDTTAVAPAVVEPVATTPKARPAKVRAASRPAPRRAAARPSRQGSECLPEQAKGQGYAYGRCDEVPRGAAASSTATARTGRR
jgi:hypothetical protein